MPIAEVWTATGGWKLAAQPLAGGAYFAELTGVSCSSTMACTAVGERTSGSGFGPLAERWNGTSWAIETTPTPSGAKYAYLFGVSCPSTTACTAVGDFVTNTSTFATATLAEHWNGTTWTIQATPVVAGATSNDLLGVSCTSTTTCTAVGWYQKGAQLALAEQWNGTNWTVQTVPTPTGGKNPNLNGVSCLSATVCTAIGAVSKNGSPQTLAERYQ